MKGFFIGLILIILLGAGGFFGYKYIASQNLSKTDNPVFKTETVVKTGILQNAKADDYTHLLLSEGKTIGVNSYSVKLNEYNGKKVEIKGQYSGSTLFADSINEVK